MSDETPPTPPVSLPVVASSLAASGSAQGTATTRHRRSRATLTGLRQRSPRLTTQSWIALVAGSIFVMMAVIIAFTPIPYVTWAPGTTVDLLASDSGKPVVEIDGLKNYETHGSLLMLTVSESRPDGLVSLPQGLWAYWAPKHDVLPRWLLYPESKSGAEIEREDAEQMDRSQVEAIIAGMRAAGAPVTARPMVTSVSTAGPARDKLKPGDYVLKVDNVAVTTVEQVMSALGRKKVDDRIVLVVQRGSVQETVVMNVAGTGADKRTPSLGAQFELGYTHNAKINIHIQSGIGGPSGGLMFALAVYDRLTPSSLMNGLRVAGTGTIDVNGEIGPIGGIQEKVGAAEGAKADIMLVPEANCKDLAGMQTKLRIVKVSNMNGAVAALKNLRDPATANLAPRC